MAAVNHCRCSAEASGSIASLQGVPYALARRAIATAGRRRRRYSRLLPTAAQRAGAGAARAHML
eukprot:14517256-Alexandrium_andersonii.AAC.1